LHSNKNLDPCAANLKQFSYYGALEVNNRNGSNMWTNRKPFTHNGFMTWKNQVNTKKYNSLIFRPLSSNKKVLWSTRSNDRQFGDLAWREPLGRFYMKYCPNKYFKSKKTYKELNMPTY